MNYKMMIEEETSLPIVRKAKQIEKNKRFKRKRKKRCENSSRQLTTLINKLGNDWIFLQPVLAKTHTKD